MREDGLWTEGVVAPLVGRGEGTVLGRERQHAGDVLGRHKVVGNLDARAEVEHLVGAPGRNEDGLPLPLHKGPRRHALLLPQPQPQPAAHVEALVVDRVVQGLRHGRIASLVRIVALLPHATQKGTQARRVLCPPNMPQRAHGAPLPRQPLTLAAHKLVSTRRHHRTAAACVRRDVHVSKHVDGITHVEMQLGGAGARAHQSHTTTGAPGEIGVQGVVATVGRIHFGPKVGWQREARQRRGQVEPALPAGIIWEGERLLDVGMV
mmetsp:Transcript_37753/g.121367  ORF Transcript_37753/g.121367 Transcript_37753/m.121367 type:complete len:264 (-) Transcript_37753:156-947(-)